jgi:hypothetical protein
MKLDKNEEINESKLNFSEYNEGTKFVTNFSQWRAE